MKKSLATLLLSLTVLAATASADFSDVSTAHTHYAAISSLVEQGILQGYEDGTFLPGNEVNRAEALKIILLGMGIEIEEESIAGALFSDISEDDWFFGYVGTAVGLGIVKGYDDGTFRPGETVNRAEALKMLTLAAKAEPGAPSEAPFMDVAANEWFAPYANFAKTWNVEPPQTDGLWHPADDISRANISEMIYRMQIVDSSGIAFEESTNWPAVYFSTVDARMKVPFGWNYKQTGVGAMWILDDENGQMSLLSPLENGGTILMTRYANSEGASAGTLFSQLEAGLTAKTARTTVNGYDALVVYTGDLSGSGNVYREWYLVMDNGSMVHLMAMRGNGAYADYLESYMGDAVASIEFVTDGGDVEGAVESLRGAIQVDGVGESMMSLLSDWELIETDTIGVGTGTVDYYYSPGANITVKYERSYDVILDIEDGRPPPF